LQHHLVAYRWLRFIHASFKRLRNAVVGAYFMPQHLDRGYRDPVLVAVRLRLIALACAISQVPKASWLVRRPTRSIAQTLTASSL
jgi:hypothetical protein